MLCSHCDGLMSTNCSVKRLLTKSSLAELYLMSADVQEMTVHLVEGGFVHA